MSAQGESDTARLAREAEKNALAKAAAELEAEREAMRAELAAIEEEERLEAECAKQAAKTTQTKTPGPSSSFIPLLLPGYHAFCMFTAILTFFYPFP